MKLLTKCVGCKEDIKVTSFASTRPDLERDLGENISVTCSNWHRKQTKHPNEVRAVENKYIVFIAFTIGIAISFTLWTFLGAVAGIAMAAPMYMYVAESKNVLTFNKYRL